jgi:hypothetical protein
LGFGGIDARSTQISKVPKVMGEVVSMGLIIPQMELFVLERGKRWNLDLALQCPDKTWKASAF